MEKKNIIPVHKTNSKENVDNYRPISLLSVISKIAERCVYNHIYPSIIKQLSKCQHGFLSGRSTSTQLVEFIENIGNTLDNSGQTDIIYLDFSKAFDSVSHPLLLRKLRRFGISGNMLKWFESYLAKRVQRVVVNGGTSKWLPVYSGVPQGSILGPLLFNMFINDMPDVVNISNVVLYADDTKCYNTIASEVHCNELQSDLEALYVWSTTWSLNFNASKCKVITVTRKKDPLLYDYTLNGQTLERVSCINDLGVTINDELNWSKHIDSITSKARRLCWLIKRSVGYNASTRVKKQLYVSLVRSNVEYCSQIWSGTSHININKLERVQRSATRYILNYPDSDYRDRLIKLNLLPLAYRREVLDVTFFYKILNNLYHLNVKDFISFTYSNERLTRSSNDPVYLCTQMCKTESGKKLFFNRIVNIWNSIPYNIRNSDTISIFKSQINTFYKSLFHSTFDPNNMCTWTVSCACNKCRPYA